MGRHDPLFALMRHPFSKNKLSLGRGGPFFARSYDISSKLNRVLNKERSVATHPHGFAKILRLLLKGHYLPALEEKYRTDQSFLSPRPDVQ